MAGDRKDKESRAEDILSLDEKGVQAERPAQNAKDGAKERKKEAKAKRAAAKPANALPAGTAGVLGGIGSVLALIPAVIFCSFVIMLVRTYEVTRPMGRFFWSAVADDSVLYDTFSYCKMVLIVFCAVAALAVVLVRAIAFGGARLKWSRFYIPVAVFAAAAFLSYLFSDFRDISWLGTMDRFEGTLPMLCYLIMLVFITTYVRSERDLKIMLWPLGVSLLLLGLLGAGQATGHDFFKTVTGQKLITPLVDYGDGVTSWTVIDKLFIEGDSMYSFRFNSGQVYETVYNINYVPFYLCLVLPVFAMLFLRAFEKDGKVLPRAVKGLLALGIFGISLYCFFGANSASGYFGLAAILVLGLIVFRKKLVRWAVPLLCVILVAACVMTAMQKRWLPEVKRLFAEAGELNEMIVGTVSAADGEPVKKDTYATKFSKTAGSRRSTIDRVITGENYITMRINGNTLAVMLDADGLSFYDNESDPIEIVHLKKDPGYYSLRDTRYHDYVKVGYEIRDDELYLICVTYKTTWRFHYDAAEHHFKYVTPVSTAKAPKEVIIGPIESIGFEGNYRFGSGRGYIWSRSLPLLKPHILLGSGPDTFCYVFPQEDYAGKYAYTSSIDLIIDKPHNMYMQTAVNTGGISLLAFIAMIGWVLADCLKHSCRMRGLRPLAEYVGSGIFLGLAAFAVTGFFNDTTVSTSPLFYSMLGLGFACNRIVEEAEKEAPAEAAAESAEAAAAPAAREGLG